MESDLGIEPASVTGFGSPPQDEICCVCLVILATDEGSIYRPCIRCYTAWCGTCLRDTFLAATIDESRMPCACCFNLPLSRVRKLLSPGEIALYRAKLEERNDGNRIYCPVPTCSAYIPGKRYRHLLETEGSEEVKGGDTEEGNRKPGLRCDESSGPQAAEETPLISCPECAVKICLACQQLSHQGDWCKKEPPNLEEIEKALGGSAVKQCPKCHTLTERLDGCPSIHCRCGAVWRLGCGKHYRECRSIREFSFTDLDGREKWASYKFVMGVYGDWAPSHFKKLCSAIDELPSVNFDISQQSETPHQPEVLHQSKLSFSESTGLSQGVEVVDIQGSSFTSVMDETHSGLLDIPSGASVIRESGEKLTEALKTSKKRRK